MYDNQNTVFIIGDTRIQFLRNHSKRELPEYIMGKLHTTNGSVYICALISYCPLSLVCILYWFLLVPC